MKNYGTTIRQIRLDKGFSQKEIYTGIVSKSYAIEFEKGKHDMSVGHFIEVLDRLYIDFQEFSFIHNNYQQTPELKTLTRYADAANSGNLTALIKLETELVQSKAEYDQLIAALSRLSIYSLKHHEQHILDSYPPGDVQLIQNFLMRLDSWTLNEIRLFINSGTYFSYDIRCHLMQTVTKKITKYHEYTFYNNVFSVLIINFLADVFVVGDQQHVTPYLALLDDLTQDITLSFQRDFYLFYTGLNDILWGDADEGETRCRLIIQHLDFQSHDHFATMLQNELELVLANKIAS